jgi:predicted GIY-YIG superfamily endonuclease
MTINFAAENIQVAGEAGSVYVLQFTKNGQPVKLADHAELYIGWARDVEARVSCHRTGIKGKGAAITAAAVQQGFELEVLLVIEGVDRYFERALKNRKSHASVLAAFRRDPVAFVQEYAQKALRLAAENVEAYA